MNEDMFYYQYLSPILETNYNTTNLLKSKSKLDTYEGYTQYNLKNVVKYIDENIKKIKDKYFHIKFKTSIQDILSKFYQFNHFINETEFIDLNKKHKLSLKFNNSSVIIDLQSDNNTQMALYLNNNLLLESVYSSGNANKVNYGQAIVVVSNSSTILNLKSTTNNPITLQITNGGSQTGINASITIEKIS
jgi:hypothetical protein